MSDDANLHDFQPAILAFLIVCLTMYVIVFAFSYSMYINNKMKFYQTKQTRKTLILLMGVISLIWLALAIWASLDVNTFANNAYAIPLSWVLFALSILHLIGITFFVNRLNKSKHKIADFYNEDWNRLVSELKLKVEADHVAQTLKDKHARYYSILLQKYSFIMTQLDHYDEKQYQQILTDIVMFNDMHTTKWNRKYNNLQLLFFYEMCAKLYSKSVPIA
jgi:magnesium-transporting ATPase (P-type)